MYLKTGETMNISSTNNSQPSFKGVKLSADFATQRPVIFHIMPDSVLTGIQHGENKIHSSAADLLALFIKDPQALYEHKQALRKAKPRRLTGGSSRDALSRTSIRTYVNRVIQDLGLTSKEKNRLFHYMKDVEPKTVRVEGKTDEFRLIFNREAK